MLVSFSGSQRLEIQTIYNLNIYDSKEQLLYQ